jgi:hypothetical protein
MGHLLPYVLYALIAIVSVAIVVELTGVRKRPRSGDKTSRARTAAPGDPNSDFPPTTFGVEDSGSAAATQRKQPSQETSAKPEARGAINVFPTPTATPAPRGRAESGSEENFEKLVAAALGEPQRESPDAQPPAAEFAAEKTNIYMRPLADAGNVGERKRQGMALETSNSARLVGLSGRLKGKVFSIAAAGTVIGRHPSCNVVVGDPRVSGRHAWIGLVDGKLVLRDLKSTNGTLLNAQAHRLTGDMELRSGDTIFLGGHAGTQFRLMID